MFCVLSEKFYRQFRRGLNVATVIVDIFLCDETMTSNMLLSMLNSESLAGAV